ncbi:MAG: tRNA uridine-5-carboxymethylaminomethyl(34) synthesis enzyme MnmG [Mollicutes bacterium]|nr:tRNA uridine-5-carboxymethylaminomethyl(34) synthesis enzyme MnmG [Mollicutes bacterium]
MYDIIVVGAGHAGIEAAHICAKMGFNTLLLSSNLNNIADMACNPSIGGSAKGVIVREIDALGGLMGKASDESHFQIKMLNNSKGPVIRALRAQIDKKVYPKVMRRYLDETKKLILKEGMVEDIIIKNNQVKGVILSDNKRFESKIVILTTGTYLNSNILIGDENIVSGPHGEKRSNFLSLNLKKYGINIKRLKTGTPQRIKGDSINFNVLKEEKGDDHYWTFSFDIKPQYKINEQQKCYLVYTNAKTHKIINENLDRSAMYGGYLTKGAVGPRYCPSIEDKIVRFSDKERHQLFLEPESIYYDEWYLQGFSTSMPRDVQEKMLHSLEGLENAVISKYAYAIEYDSIDPIQINASLENKIIKNLFTAGQINGTSGYEEAAAQGIMAGINAVLKLKKKEPFILKRYDAYIGVLIDDLVTKGIIDPYRMLTSRAEYRLILRHDNADIRLTEKGYKIGSVSKEKYEIFKKRVNEIEKLKQILKDKKLHINEEVKEIFKINNINVPASNINLLSLLNRPEISIEFLKNFVDLSMFSKDAIEEVEIETKYSGYIQKEYRAIEKLAKLEEKKIPEDIDYTKIKNIASEARSKLEEIRPLNIAQASRISGVNPVDISLLLIYLKKEYSKDENK